MASVFHHLKCPSAPVDWCRYPSPAVQRQALVINSGNANAFRSKRLSRRSASPPTSRRRRSLRATAVFLASTGVIGEPLDPQKFQGDARRPPPGSPEPYLDAAAKRRRPPTPSPRWRRGTITLDGVTVAIGIAKGAGMIADMATILSLFTDLPSPRQCWGLVSRGVVDELVL